METPLPARECEQIGDSTSTETLFAAEQIRVPPNLPPILKGFAKAAIRTQPYNLLLWSRAYFKAIVNGETPPAKRRLEYPLPKTSFGLTFGYLRLFIDRHGKGGKISRVALVQSWKDVSLPYDALEELLSLGRFQKEVDLDKFIALAAATFEPNLKRTMILLCELLTEEPEGGSAMVPFEVLADLYKYLAAMDCGPKDFNARPLEYTNRPSDVFLKANEGETEKPKHAQSWESLLKEIKEQDSIGSFATIDEITSDGGLMVWPHISDPDISETVLVGSVPSEEGLTSAYGLQVWGVGAHETQKVQWAEGPDQESRPQSEEEAGVEKQRKEEAAEGVEEVTEEEKAGEVHEEEVSEESEGPELEDDEGEGEEKEEGDFTAEGGELESTGREVGDKIDVKKGKKGKKKEIESVTKEEVPKDKHIVTVFEDKKRILPTPCLSDIDLKEGIRDLTECSDTSVGMPLRKKLSLADVRVMSKDKEEWETKSEETVVAVEEPPPPYWMPVPGIGPPVPQATVDSVIKYLRECSNNQKGMVMPRNLVHFLCPPLEVMHDV